MSETRDEIDEQIAHVSRVLRLLTDGQDLSIEYMHVMILMLAKQWALTARIAGTCSACTLAIADTVLAKTTGDWLPHNRACLELEREPVVPRTVQDKGEGGL